LFAVPSLSGLDEAFAAEVAAGYAATLADAAAGLPDAAQQLPMLQAQARDAQARLAETEVWGIMMRVRQLNRHAPLLLFMAAGCGVPVC
jgi:hypothetical protein